MKHCVGIIAPLMGEFADEKGLEFPFRLALKSTGKELTLHTIYELAASSWKANTAARSHVPADDGMTPAAAYYLSALLRAHGYDTVAANNLSDATLAQLAAADPIAICISTTMIMKYSVLARYVERLRAAIPDVTIIVGGPLIWKSYKWLRLLAGNPAIAHNEFLNIQDFDDFVFSPRQKQLDVDAFVVSTHGGRILLQLLQQIERARTEFDDIPNLALHAPDGTLYFTPRADEHPDYDSDITRWDHLDRLPPAIPLTTSYGCPYRCGFCDFCTLQPNLFMRTTESLSAELALLKNLLPSQPQVRSIAFTDDNVFISPRRVHELCETLIQSSINLPWTGFIRAASVTPSNIDIIKYSYLMVPSIGVESGDLGQLQRMMKKTTPENLKRGIELLDGIGAAVKMFFVVGYPGETDITIGNTAAFINGLSTSLARYSVFPFRLSPLSPVSMPMNRQKFKLYGVSDTWSHETMNAAHATDGCRMLCHQVSEMPYDYLEENMLFNARFMGGALKKLNALRNQTTVLVLEDQSWDKVAEGFACIAEIMGLGKRYPTLALKEEIICSS